MVLRGTLVRAPTLSVVYGRIRRGSTLVSSVGWPEMQVTCNCSLIPRPGDETKHNMQVYRPESDYVDLSLPQKSARSSCYVTDKLIIAVTSTYRVSHAKSVPGCSPCKRTNNRTSALVVT